jgi:NADH-quinone oxidoreductase subunit N
MSLRSHVGNVEIKYIRELINMSKNNPMLAINIAITLFSVAGIPPLAGFYSKLYVFSSAINDNMYLLAVIGVLTSVIAAFYYIYLIRIIYFDKSVIYVYLNSIDRNSAIIISITFLFIVLLFLFSSSILQYTHYLSLLLSI